MTEYALTVLENTLAAELRVSQAIAALTELERSALQTNDLAALTDVVRKKEQHMEELSRLEAEYDEALTTCKASQGDSTFGDATLDEVLSSIDRQSARRIKVLRDGVQAYLERSRSLSRGNQALLQTALERNADLRNFLLRLGGSDDTYSSEGERYSSDPTDYFVDWSG